MAMNLTASYTLANDIDLTGTFSPVNSQYSGMWGSAGFSPIGNLSTPFTGRFDGQGYTITGLTINRPATSYVGLFGYGLNSDIRNVGLIGGSVAGRAFTGALIGRNSGDVTESYSSVNMTGYGQTGQYVGGLVGESFGTVSYSYATGNVANVSGFGRAGGLVGRNWGGTISYSYATGNVSGAGPYVGGLVGINTNFQTAGARDGIIINSYATGNVSGVDRVGGLAGANEVNDSFNSGTTARITNAYATGNVSGTTNVGGLVGLNSGASMIVPPAVIQSYWDTETTGQTTSAGSNASFGLTSAQMRQQASFAGWDFSSNWRIYETQTRPLLRGFLTPLAISTQNQTKIFDGIPFAASSLLFTGAFDPAKLFVSGSASGTVNAGTYGFSAYSNQLGYDLSGDLAATLTITPRPLTVTADSGQRKVYGASDPAFTYSLTSGSLVGGDSFSGTLARAAGENAGTYLISQGILTAGSNYNLTYVSSAFAITARPLTVTADSGLTKVYGNADPALSYSLTSGSLVGGDSLSGTLARAAGETAGSYTISQGTLTAGSNYSLTYTDALFRIDKAPLLVRVRDAVRPYGQRNPVFTALFSGLQGSDPASIVSGLAFASSAVPDSPVGAYAITASGGVAANYDLTLQSGLLTVTGIAQQEKATGNGLLQPITRALGTARSRLGPLGLTTDQWLVSPDDFIAISGTTQGEVSPKN